jgi:ABC-type transporter Mla subunit MlaD
MAKQNRSAFRAGLFIVVAGFLIGGVIVGIKGIRTVFTPVVQRKVHFLLTDDVGGLRLGDDVRLGGFKVGVIQKIAVVGLEDNQTPGIIITFTIPTSYPLHDNAHMAVQGTLTGSTWLNIDDMGSGTLLADGAELTGHPSATTALLASLSGAAPDLAGILHDARTITLPKVNNTVDKANTALNSGRGAFDSISSLFGDTKPDIRGFMSNLNGITASAKAKIPGILDHADSALVKVGETLDNAKGALEDVKATMANAHQLSGAARDVLVNNRGKLDGIIASLKSTSDNLKGASAEIRRSPWRILYKPAPGEMENMELYDAARQFADGANSVNDASLALRDAMQNPNVDHDQVQKLMDKLDESFSNFHQVEQKLWTAVKQ